MKRRFDFTQLRGFAPAAALAMLAASPSPAIATAQDRVDPIPEGPEIVVEALSPFAGNPDSSRVAEILGEAARATGFPQSEYDRVLVARLWRRAGQTDLAMRSLETISGESAAVSLARYEGARVLLESGRAEDKGLGISLYWAACAALDSATRDAIMWDLLAETTPREREDWAGVAHGEPTCEWVRRFWEERAQRMVIPPDERVRLHFERLAVARDGYYLASPRYLAGMADSFGRAPGLAVDDRGLLYIRMGPPYHDEPCPEEVGSRISTVNPKREPPDRLARCWVYEGPKGYRIFHLAMKDRFKSTGHQGEAYGPDYTADNDYRIQEDLGQRAEPGNAFFHKYVMNADLPKATKVALVRRGPAFRIARLIQDSVFLPLNFRDPTFDAWSETLDRLEGRRYDRSATVSLRRIAAEALEQIPDIPAIALTANMRFEALRFLNPREKEWQIWLIAAVPAGQLARSDTLAGPATLDVAGRFSLLRPGGMTLHRMAPLSVPAAAAPPDAGISLRGVATVGPGPVPLSLIVEDLNRPGTGAWAQDTLNIPSIGGLPQLSDIAVAQQTGGTWTRDGETYLQVSPAHMTNADGSIHTYFEVYGVRPGTGYEVELRLAPVDVAERIWRLEEGDLGFRLLFASEMPGDIGRHHLRLDLGDTEPGEYILAVRIQDEKSKAYSLPAITDVFVAER